MKESNVCLGAIYNTPLQKKSYNIIKSPSDTTLYMQDLCKVGDHNGKLIDKILNFVEGIQPESERRGTQVVMQV